MRAMFSNKDSYVEIDTLIYVFIWVISVAEVLGVKTKILRLERWQLI